jgi:hypothetical protein
MRRTTGKSKAAVEKASNNTRKRVERVHIAAEQCLNQRRQDISNNGRRGPRIARLLLSNDSHDGCLLVPLPLWSRPLRRAAANCEFQTCRTTTSTLEYPFSNPFGRIANRNATR